MKERFAAIGATALLVFMPMASVVHAATWQGGEKSGRLSLVFHYQGSKERGRFARFHVRLVTRHGRPLTLLVVTSTASFTVHSQLLDRAARGHAWFDVQRHPRAIYRASRFVTGPTTVRAQGVLQLKGIRHPLTLLMTLTPRGDDLLLRGTGVVDRIAFRIGTGSWAKTDLIGRRVFLNYEVLLHRVHP